MSGNGSSPSTSGPSPRRASSDSPLKMCSIVSKLRLMPNTRSLCAGLLVALATACGSRGAERTLLATRVPVARLDSVLKAADSVRLPLGDARVPGRRHLSRHVRRLDLQRALEGRHGARARPDAARARPHRPLQPVPRRPSAAARYAPRKNETRLGDDRRRVRRWNAAQSLGRPPGTIGLKCCVDATRNALPSVALATPRELCSLCSSRPSRNDTYFRGLPMTGLPMSDAQLVERMAAGDRRAHEQLGERHRLSLYARVYG